MIREDAVGKLNPLIGPCAERCAPLMDLLLDELLLVLLQLGLQDLVQPLLCGLALLLFCGVCFFAVSFILLFVF